MAMPARFKEPWPKREVPGSYSCLGEADEVESEITQHGFLQLSQV